MLKAELYATNQNGKLSFDWDNLQLQFDDFHGEVEFLINKENVVPGHKENDLMLYDLEFTRGKAGELILLSCLAR